jgi:hypothetical protein
MQSLASKVTSSEIDSSEKKADSVVAKLFPSSPDAKQKDQPPLYWYSTGARKLFAPNLSEEVSLFQHLKERILKFDAALKLGNLFNELLEPDLKRGDLTTFETINIFVKIRCLKKATSLALELLGRHDDRKTWRDCCELTCAWADGIGGSEYPKNFETIQKWNICFRAKLHFTRYHHRSRKAKLPPLLFDNPEETFAI